MATLNQAHEWFTLFSGYSSAYGVHVPGEADEKGKRKGKSWTEHKVLTEELFISHLSGDKSIGVVPINEEGKCNFAALDYDEYHKDLMDIVDMLYYWEFPMFPFRSKSGGLHLFIFFREPQSAKQVIDTLKEIRPLLGLDNKTEIFPKQTVRNSDPEKIGSWINLPYQNADKGTERYLYGKDHKGLILDEAIIRCKAGRTTCKELIEFIQALPLSDAPPCLQHLYLKRNTVNRNTYLFCIAHYYKVKTGDDFAVHLNDANSMLQEPLEKDEIENILRSHKKKEYTYKCEEPPLVDLCNRQECVKRQYGAKSESVNSLSFEGLTQYLTDPPYYEWTVNGQIMKFFKEEDIMYQNEFRKVCFRALHKLPYRLKDEAWTRIVNNQLSEMEVKYVDRTDDISPGAMFFELLCEFLTKRAMADTVEQILVDKVYDNDGWYYFKSKNLVDFLVHQKQFRYFSTVEVQAKLKDLGGKPERLYVNKKNTNVRVWTLPHKAIEAYIETDQDKVMLDFKEEFKDEDF